MNQNPASIIFNTDGYELALKDGDSISSYQPALLIGAEDGYSNFRILKIQNDALSVTTKPSRNVLGRYFANSGIINGAAAAQNLLSIENPIGSNKSVFITRIDVNGMIAANFSTAFLYSVTRTTAIPSGGTVLTAQKRKTTDSANSAIVRQAPTATEATGSIWVGSPGLTVAGYNSSPKYETSFTTENEDFEILLTPGEGLLVNAGVNAVGWRHYVNIRWSEI